MFNSENQENLEKLLFLKAVIAFLFSLGQSDRLQAVSEAWTCGKFYESWEVITTLENFFGILIPIICKV